MDPMPAHRGGAQPNLGEGFTAAIRAGQSGKNSRAWGQQPSSDNCAMTKKEMMDYVVKKVGAAEARALVMNAYNAEIISNRIGRMEAKTGIDLRTPKKDLLALAVARVHELLSLME
jgi:hypothetical protein